LASNGASSRRVLLKTCYNRLRFGYLFEHGYLCVVIGIGIVLHLREVALGFLKPPGKQAITMIGDTATVAARLCSRARASEVLFS
jgi:class 3 adenylate cyclase